MKKFKNNFKMTSFRINLKNIYLFFVVFLSFLLIAYFPTLCFSLENKNIDTKKIIQIQYEEGLFSGNIENAEIIEVIEKIGEVSNITFEIKEGVKGIIKGLKFEDLEVERLLERLIDPQGRGLVIFFDKEKAKRVIISKKIGDDSEKKLLKEKEDLSIRYQDLEELIAKLSSYSSFQERTEAAQDIILLGKEVIPYLIKYLDKSSDFLQQYSLIKILYTLEAAEAKDEFIKLANSGDTQLSIAALYGLSRLKNHKVTVPLYQIIKNTKNADIKGVALLSLGESADKNAIPLLLEELHNEKNGMKNNAIATLSLAKLDNKEGLENALEIAEKGPLDAKEFAIAALGQIGDKKAVPFLEKLKDDSKNSSIEVRIFIAIQEINNKSDDPSYLESLLKHKDKDIGLWALERLGDIGTPEAINVLEKTLEEGLTTYSFDVAKEFVNLGYKVSRNIKKGGYLIGERGVN